jgi:nucleoside 2-deoxyribosyltransferase
MSQRVYLCGPIAGCTDDEATNWRELVKAALGEEACIDPMRRDYRGREDANVSEIVLGDEADIRDCDVVLANCWHVSWGTAMEIFYAASIDKPVIAVVAPGTRVSPWLSYHARVVPSLDAALDLVR